MVEDIFTIPLKRPEYNINSIVWPFKITIADLTKGRPNTVDECRRMTAKDCIHDDILELISNQEVRYQFSYVRDHAEVTIFLTFVSDEHRLMFRMML